MTKKLEFLKRTFSALFASTLVLGLVFVSGCDDDEPEPEPYSIAGIYTFAEAILQTEITVGPVTLPAGTDITEQMSGGLLSGAGCTNPANGAVDMKANNTLWFTCMTEGTETQAGTWALNSTQDKLTLNLSSPAPLQLSVDDLVINETTGEISGTIYNFPLTPDLIVGFFPEGTPQNVIDAILATLPPATLVTVDIAFAKES